MKVSIITICLNGAALIEKTINSVIGQTYDNIEYIIIDGGSTDGTVDIIKKFEKNIDYWVSEKDGGIYNAMNKGIRKASGDLIGIINCGDWYENNTVELVVDYFQNNEVGWIHGDLMLVNDKEEERLLTWRGRNDDLYTWYDHPTVFIKKTLYDKYGLYNEKYKIIADANYMLRLKQKGEKAGYIDEVLAHFCEGGLSSKISNRFIYEIRNVFEDILAFHSDDVLAQNAIKERCDWTIRFHLYNNVKEKIKNVNDADKLFKFILQLTDKKKIVIWGMGDDCKKLITNTFISSNYVRCFVSGKHEEGSFRNKPIVSPNKITSDDYIVVSTRKYYSEISEYLSEQGNKEGFDYVSFERFKELVVDTLYYTNMMSSDALRY